MIPSRYFLMVGNVFVIACHFHIVYTLLQYRSQLPETTPLNDAGEYNQSRQVDNILQICLTRIPYGRLACMV